MDTIERTPIRDLVYNRLLQSILCGEFEPGARVMDTAVAEQLGVSRTPVRETLLRLEREGLLASSPGRGFTVAPLDADEARECYPVLWTLEILALSMSGPPEEDGMEKMRAINAKMADPALDPLARIELDADWHETLLADCQNRRLSDIITTLRLVIRRYEYAFMKMPDMVTDSTRDHDEIVDLLNEGDVNAMSHLLERHWQRSLLLVTYKMSR